MTEQRESSGGLEPQDFTRQRDEASKEGVRGLLIINGGGAVALLAFLQAIWSQDPLLSRYVVFGLAILSLGVFFAGLASFLRYHASLNFQKRRRDRWLLFRGGYTGCWYVSLGLFLFGISVVIYGALVSKGTLKTEWQWYQNRKANVGFTTGALFLGPEDIPYPEIQVVRDGWKIISQANDRVSWGWRMEISASKIPVEKIPEEYKKIEKRGRWEIHPPENPSFNVKITYKLEDNDGFVVAEDTLSTSITAGETQMFQDESAMPIGKAMRAARSTFDITFQKTKRN